MEGLRRGRCGTGEGEWEREGKETDFTCQVEAEESRVMANKGACSRRFDSPSQSGNNYIVTKLERDECRSIGVRRTLPGLTCKNGGMIVGKQKKKRGRSRSQS